MWQSVYAHEIWNDKNFYCLFRICIQWLCEWKLWHLMVHYFAQNFQLFIVVVDRAHWNEKKKKKRRWRKNCAESITNMLYDSNCAYTQNLMFRSVLLECDFFDRKLFFVLFLRFCSGSCSHRRCYWMAFRMPYNNRT